jgi:aryl-alcohol dehydrogenase-like predicted oxidoreductase
VNWVDTAPIYGFGRAEEVVGRALKPIREKPFLVTKCSRVWDKDRTVTGNLTEASLRSELEQSLRRLQTDTIDMYLMHYPLPEQDLERGWATLAEFVREGKVRFIGVSNAGMDQLKILQAVHPIDCIQPPYSMLNRGIEKDVIRYCEEKGIGIIAYSPMQNGLLTGKYTIERILALPEDDFRRRDKHFTEPELGANLEFIASLSGLAASRGKTLAQVAIAWVLRQESVTAAIVGARKPVQIEETYQAGDWNLNEADVAEVEALLRIRSSRLG